MCGVVRIGSRTINLKDQEIRLHPSNRPIRFKDFCNLRNENSRWRNTEIGSIRLDSVLECGSWIEIPRGVKAVIGRDPEDGLFGLFTVDMEHIHHPETTEGFHMLKCGRLEHMHISDVAYRVMRQIANHTRYDRSLALIQP